MIAIDTTGIIDLFKGEEKIKKLLEEVKEPIVTTQINYLEIFFGIDINNSEYFDEIEYYNEFFDFVIPLHLNNNSCKKASDIFHKLKKQGKNIGKFDCIIAGILLNEKIDKIITRNVKHFENVPGLKVIEY